MREVAGSCSRSRTRAGSCGWATTSTTWAAAGRFFDWALPPLRWMALASLGRPRRVGPGGGPSQRSRPRLPGEQVPTSNLDGEIAGACFVGDDVVLSTGEEGTPRSQGRSGRTVLPGGRRRRRASSGLWPSTRHPGTCCRWVASSRSTATRAGTTRAAVQSGSSGRSWRPAPRTRRSPGTRRSPARPGWLSTSAVIGSHTHRRPAGHRHPLGCVNARTGVRRWHSGAEEERRWTRRCSSRRGARCTAWPSW